VYAFDLISNALWAARMSAPPRWQPPPPRLCTLCSGRCYPVEEQLVDGAIYHKGCFRCQTCSKARLCLCSALRGSLRGARSGSVAPRVNRSIDPRRDSSAPFALLRSWLLCAHSCSKALSLGEFASYRLPSGGLVIFCKPHFKQAFQESGGKYSGLAAEGSVPPSSPLTGASPSQSYRPSGIALFDDDQPAIVHKREPAKKDKSAFESGFPQEFKLGSASKMLVNKCTACSTKVFPFCKVEFEGQLYHNDCFKCAVCQLQLTEKTADCDADNKPACFQHRRR
jgi:LIM domain